jgi:hypothetical protein
MHSSLSLSTASTFAFIRKPFLTNQRQDHSEHTHVLAVKQKSDLMRSRLFKRCFKWLA